MKNEEYPALYRLADQSSVAAQRWYLWLINAEFVLLVSAATIALWFGYLTGVYIVFVLLVAASIALLLYLSARKPEQDWYGCRALAESIKTAAWRYMMRASPFSETSSISEVNKKYGNFLREILDANVHVRGSISRRPISGDQITAAMAAKRSMSLNSRIACYMNERVFEQRNWYVNKAAENLRQFQMWVAGCVAVQVVAITIALLRMAYDEHWSIWPAEPLLVLASSLVGWIQMKRFSELAFAYNLAAHEIGIIEGQIKLTANEEEFSEFVNEAERAFSREHTQWVARQDALRR